MPGDVANTLLAAFSEARDRAVFDALVQLWQHRDEYAEALYAFICTTNADIDERRARKQARTNLKSKRTREANRRAKEKENAANLVDSGTYADPN